MVDVDTAPRVAPPGAPSLAGEAPACRLPAVAATAGGAVPSDEERALQVRPSLDTWVPWAWPRGPPRGSEAVQRRAPRSGVGAPGNGAPPAPCGPQDGIAR